MIVTGTPLAFWRSDAPAQAPHPTLTFAERVAYQRAIEDVYWRHRVWPKERPDPKPSLNAVISQAQLERKVHDYLRKSQALQDYWQQPITAEQLQAEMDRMAEHTKQPEVLQELFEALDNDPFLIAECLARPILSEHLVTNVHVHGQGSHGELKLWAGSWRASAEYQTLNGMTAASASYTLPTISDGAACGDDTWTATSATNAPSARPGHTAVWTGSEMIVWGGFNGSGYLNTGGRYNPGTDSWAAITTINAPTARGGHTAVWTGSEMIVWGGDDGHSLNTGGRYNPANDTWTATNTTNAPLGRLFHTAVWTGSDMILWGGWNEIELSTGSRYNPGTDSWTATGTTNAPTARFNHTAVWTGKEMIIWGGWNGSNYFSTGGRYNPSTNSWAATSTAIAPTGRYYHTAVWTGNEMIIWGGWNGSNYFNTGGRYNPSTNSWTATSTTNAPAGRASHTAVWTGSEMIVWGGNNPTQLNTGGRYCPAAPNPTATPTPTSTPTPTPTIIVTNTNDSGPGSLRQALADANDGDIIGFAVTGTIGLTSSELLVDKNITISGPGAENLAVNGNGKSTVFHIAPGETVTISGLTITNGYTTGSGGGIHNDHADLTLNDCTVSGNQGGGIYNDAENSGGALLEINNCSVTDNSGGGIYNDALGGGVATLNITDSSVNNNYSGGAILSRGWLCTFCPHGTATVQITNSSITGNGSTPYGGAIYTDTGGPCCPVTVSLTNSTVSGNAGEAVHISIEAALLVSNSTISGNSGGGIYTDLGAPTGGSTVVNSTMNDNQVEIWYGGAYIKNTIFKVSPGGHSIVSDGFSTIMSQGYNVSSDDGAGYLNGPGDQINTDPLLGPLQDNGGPTFTHALSPGSPAIDAGDPNFVPPPLYDQRGPGL